MSFKAGYRFGQILAEFIHRFFGYFGRPKMRGLSSRSQIRELRKLSKSVEAAHRDSVFHDLEAYELAAVVSVDAIDEAGHYPGSALAHPFFEATLELAECDGLLQRPSLENPHELTWSQQLAVRSRLYRLKQIYSGSDSMLDYWVNLLIYIFKAILAALPKGINFEEKNTTFFTIDMVHLLDDSALCIEQIIEAIRDEELLFYDFKKTVETNVFTVSEINPLDPKDTKPVIFPTASKLGPYQLVDAYLRDTVFEKIFYCQCPFALPANARFEHCHIVGGTGHGKTQLLQTLILDDIKNNRGCCVIDSQGDLIRNVTMLQCFDPCVNESLSEKLIIIDPSDVEFPACLNMFAMSSTDMASLTSTQKEMYLNATVDLYAYMFGALFGAELTQRQGVIFTYLARLMMEIPQATIQTLRKLLEDGKPFKPYMEQLEGSARAFFETQFFSQSFAQTKKQVLTRLWGVLANATLERMFTNTENKIDLFSAMNEGKIVLINTAKDILRSEGSKILGRFFIALLGQAIIQRASIPEKDRKPFFVYIDEAHEYFDENINDQLNQARKFKVGITLSHQNLEQLSPALKATVMASTSIKLAGGVNSADAAALAREMHTTADTILQARKTENETQFLCWIKNNTPSAIPITVQFGILEKEPILSQKSYTQLVQRNRAKYCVPQQQIVYATPPTQLPSEKTSIVKADEHSTTGASDKRKHERPVISQAAIKKERDNVPARKAIIKERKDKPVTVDEGNRGAQHRYLQNLIQRYAREHGFTAEIEKPVLQRAGRVDVALEGSGRKIGIEITVTTNPEWEIHNISKCLSAGYDPVILICADNKKLNKYKKEVLAALGEKEYSEKVLFFVPDAFLEYLETITPEPQQSVKTIRGYTVKTTYSKVSSSEEKMKKDAIAKVITDSLKRLK